MVLNTAAAPEAGLVVVTGADGFAGRAGCAHFRAAGVPFRGLVRTLSGATAARLDMLPVGDFATIPDVTRDQDLTKKALAAMQEMLLRSHFYPDGGGYYLREAIAAKVGLKRENVILGAGSNEIIEFIDKAFLNPGDDIIAARHAFVVYKLMATLFGANTIEVPDPGYAHDLDAMLARLRTAFFTGLMLLAPLAVTLIAPVPKLVARMPVVPETVPAGTAIARSVASVTSTVRCEMSAYT